MLNYSSKEIASELVKQIYGSSSQGCTANKISDLINNEKGNTKILLLALERKYTRELARIVSSILRELQDDRLKNSCDIVDIIIKISEIDDFRVWSDLVRPIYFNLEKDNFNKLFIKGLKHHNIITRGFFFEKIVDFSDLEIIGIINNLDNPIEKEYVSKFLSLNDLSLKWCMDNIHNKNVFIKNIIFRLVEKSNKFDFEEVLSLIRYANDEDIWEAFSFYSKFSENLITI